MASAKVQGAAAGASAGAKIGSAVPGVGTAIGAGIGAVVGFLSGGKGTYAQTTGIEVQGTLSKAGFVGSATGLAENAGVKYRDALAPSSGPYFHIKANLDEAFKSYFGADSDAVLPVGFVIPGDQVNDFGKYVQGQVQAAAPRIGESGGDPLAGLLGAFGGGGNVTAPTIGNLTQSGGGPQTGIALASAAPAGGGNNIGLLALLGGLFYMVTHG